MIIIVGPSLLPARARAQGRLDRRGEWRARHDVRRLRHRPRGQERDLLRQVPAVIRGAGASTSFGEYLQVGGAARHLAPLALSPSRITAHVTSRDVVGHVPLHSTWTRPPRGGRHRCSTRAPRRLRCDLPCDLPCDCRVIIV
eukprot:2434285-Prymnesium_polylepis.2